MVPNTPSCYCILLMLPSPLKFLRSLFHIHVHALLIEASLAVLRGSPANLTVPKCHTHYRSHRSIILAIVNVKCKVHLRRGHEGLERENRYSSPLSLSLALDGVAGQKPRPGRSNPGQENRYDNKGTHISFVPKKCFRHLV